MEKAPHRRLLVLVPLCFVLCYMLNIWVVELRRTEAYLGIVAREMAWNGDFLRTTFHGEPTKTFPQYPMWVAVCSGLGIPNTLTTRLPSALAVLATAIVCGVFVTRRQGRLAGVVAGSMVMANFACLRVGQRAQGETLHMLWLTCAWLSWYSFGQERKRWGYAWSASLLFVFLGCMTVGARALFYFYVPFFFLKHPVRGRRRLLQPYHLAALVVFGVGLFLWFRTSPDQPFMPWNAEHMRDIDSTSYVVGRFAFLLKLALYLMPWTAFAWTPFCVAFRPVERAPVLFHFLRTQMVSLFLFLWLMPKTSPLDLLPALPALAILAGCHFDILMRRHRKPLERYVKALGWLGLLVACTCLLAGVLHVFGFLSVVGLSLRFLIWNAGLLAIAALLATMALRVDCKGDCSFWLRFMLATCAIRVVVAAIIPPLEDWRGNERRQLAMVLTGEMPASQLHGGSGPTYQPSVVPELPSAPEPAASAERSPSESPPVLRPWGLPEEVEVVYVYGPPLIIESFYMGRMALRVENLEQDLPADEPVVYVLGREERPILPSRTWTAVSPALDNRRRNTFTWAWHPSDWCLLEFQVVPDTSGDSKPNPVRLYRGVLR